MKKHWYRWVIGILFVVGILLRLNFFIHTNIFGDDECRLILTLLDKGFLGLFGPLGDAQSAPPVFTVWSKFLINVFGVKEQIIKLTPFAAAIASIFMFYKLTLKLFTRKIAVIAACIPFLFARNLIEFSVVFKQYSTDILTAVLCMYFLPEIDLDKLNKKQLIALAFGLILLPLVSLPAMFFAGAFLMLNLIKNKNCKPVICAIPLVLFFIGYYFLTLLPSRASLDFYFPNYWDSGFIELSLKSLIGVISFHLKYLFYPNSLTLFTFILFLWGIYLYWKEGSERGKYILITLVLILLASVLRQYPLLGRVALYTAPIFILIITKPLDNEGKKFWAALICFVISFCGYNFHYFKQISNPDNSFKYSPKKLMYILKDKYQPDEAVLINDASASSYLLYSSLLKFRPEESFLMNIDNPADEEHTLNYLNNLKNGQKFWFYMVKDYRKKPVFSYILSWLENQNVIYKYQDKNSYLFLIQK